MYLRSQSLFFFLMLCHYKLDARIDPAKVGNAMDFVKKKKKKHLNDQTQALCAIYYKSWSSVSLNALVREIHDIRV